MKINVNHPSFISFVETVTKNVLSNIPLENYFNLPQEKKLGVQYMVFKFLKSSVKVRAKLTDNELKSLLPQLCKKNEEFENYEFSAVLNDIMNNYDSVSEFTNTPKRVVKTPKTDKTVRKVKPNNDQK